MLQKPSERRSRNMAAVKRTGTQPEKRLRSALHRAGFRFRVDFAVRLGGRIVRPDIAFTRARVAVFVDGCFWHKCPLHGSMPATNVDFWRDKLDGNVARDMQQSELLASSGWVVVRVWEHESTSDAFATVQSALDSRLRPRLT